MTYAPFSDDEIKLAFLHMNPNASPGPDGFGPSFYRSFWPHIKHLIIPFFHEFANSSSQTEQFNRSAMILLPKTEGADNAGAFRPIALQNCPIKGIAKLLTNRLKI